MKLTDLTVLQEVDCLEALRVMDMNRQGFVIACDGNFHAVGVLTDGDVRRAAIRAGGDLSRILVANACTRDFSRVGRSADLSHLIEFFDDGRIKFLPVVDNDGRLLDVITRKQMQSLVLQCIELPELGGMFCIDEGPADFEVHRRPWGIYKTTVLQERYQSKVIHVNPGARLSLQYHLRREERWTVAGGEGVAQIGESLVPMRPGDTLFIPKGCKHRISNTSDTEFLIVSEVQIGDYFGEDDIIRLEDDYGREAERGIDA